MVLHQVIAVFLVRRVGEDGFGPQVRGQVSIRLGDGGIGGLGKVTKGSSAATG